MKLLGKVEMIAMLKEKIAQSSKKEEAKKLKKLLNQLVKGGDASYI